MKRIECQGKSFVTTAAIAEAVAAFAAAASQRGRTVRVDVPGVDAARRPVPLILFPGEKLTVLECPMSPVHLDSTRLIESLRARQSSWISRAARA